MSQLPESINLRAPLGTVKALEEAAAREGKRPAQIIREAVLSRLAASNRKEAA